MTSMDQDPVILNVDDTDAARYAKSRILSRAGFRVIEAATGAEAISKAMGEKPALVLLDVKLPDINGFEVCRRLKNNTDTKTILVLQTSASYIGTSDKIRALEGGADNYLFEPIEPEELVANVRALLRLSHVERELREVDRRKDEFLAVLAHELRNPLGPIRNAVELMRGLDPNDREAHENAHQTILRQTEHMVRLVDDLLDVARISQGKLSLQKQPVELRGIIDAAIETARPMIEGRRHKLSAELPKDEIWIDGDGVRLSQTICNVLNNAAKFTGQGGEIALSAEKRDGVVCIQVRDNGIGIPPDELDAIFSMFAQAGHSADRVKDGLGIGLSLSKTLVELHNGSIAAYSEGVGQGSRFEICLPLLAAAPAAPQAATAEVDPRKLAYRILVVDDNHDAAEIISELLRISGHEVMTVHTGKDALAMAASFLPDIAILDLGLPDMDGTTVAAKLRQMPEASKASLIALTGYGKPADIERTQAAGFDDHLVKPVKFDHLMETIARLRSQAV
ncbi:response regulator [Noviherbaspirillum sp. CPCC 100848]|uniref:histidine kinase n=1 Tax=Noviherbaspirillum album TaxID=3080276 RepID=A0ABU6J2N4_9BURK|nr:response regulator [Noviherbaspirillum sp. CPCC 100848]MEC4717874.1 response regulator [Noviherbaspirillum sp. CPCC 100848]